MQELDPLGIGSYMRSRMRELLGTDVLGAEPVDVPRFSLNEPALFVEEMLLEPNQVSTSTLMWNGHFLKPN